LPYSNKINSITT